MTVFLRAARGDMKPASFIVLFFAVTLIGIADGQPVVSEKPLVVLMSRNPWLHIIGSDSPAFVLYENGLVIFQRIGKDGRLEYVSAVLTVPERDQFLGSLSFAKAFDNLAPLYRLTLTFHQQTKYLWLWHQNKVHRVGLYGSIGKDYYYFVKIGELPAVPSALLDLVEKIDKFDHARAQPWHPAKIEVMAQPNPVDIKMSIPWPKDLPGIRDQTTVRRGSLYSIYIDYSRFLDLSQIVKERGRNPVFFIDGKTYSADFRIPFPGEAAWMR